jgi:DNA polymerase-1
MSTVILIDGTSYIFRAFHALPRFTTATGLHTGAIYGFCSMLKKLLNDHPNTPIVLFFDGGGRNFRHDLYLDYKSHRKECPEELRQQLEHIYAISQLFGFPVIKQIGVEADDLIGTVAVHYAQFGEVYISSADKDFCQLLTEKIHLENTQESRKITAQGVFDKYGVKPDQFIDYLALQGDVSDNIPGVPKIGKITAAKWLNEFHSLEQLIEQQDLLKGKVGDSFRAHIQDAVLSKKLATIKTDLSWPEGLPQHTYPEFPNPDLEALSLQYEFFEFKTLLPKRLQEKKTGPTYEYIVIDTDLLLAQVLEDLSAYRVIAIHLETTGLNPRASTISAIGLCGSWEKSYLIPCHENSSFLKKTLSWLKESFVNSKQCWIAHHWKREAAFFYHLMRSLPSDYADIMVMSYVLNAEKKHDLKSLALDHLNWPLDQQTKEKNNEKNLTGLSLEMMQPAHDVAATFRLYHFFLKELEACSSLMNVYQCIDNPLAMVLMRMEQTGILFDCQKIINLEQELKEELNKLSNNIYYYAGKSFNINSAKQLRELLFTSLELPSLRKTPKGEPSTDEDVLIDLKPKHPIIPLLLEYRQLEKLRSTYTTSLLQQVDMITHRLHTTYHQTGTITGRLASSSPNLQNIPIKSKYGRKIRQAFIASPGYVLLSLDYSQIELRLMAHFSADPVLLEAYKKEQDIHKKTASTLFECGIETINDEQRQIAKTVNFGLIYGMSAWGLAKQLHITRDQAQHFIDTYFQQYPYVLAYMESMKQFAAEHGYVETLLGRRIPIERQKKTLSQNAFRAAINGPLQGTASDLIKLAMLSIDKNLQDYNEEIRLLLQVHDELIFEVKEEVAQIWAEKIATIMSDSLVLAVPLSVNSAFGSNWNDAH